MLFCLCAAFFSVFHVKHSELLKDVDFYMCIFCTYVCVSTCNGKCMCVFDGDVCPL